MAEGASAGCAIGTVWAGPAGTTLPLLGKCQLPPALDTELRAGDLVYTNACGRAVLNSRCGTIYIFQDSQLRISSCAPGGSDVVDCLDYGAIGMDNTCHFEPVRFVTPNSSFALEGTWVGVIYVPDRRVTVFTVLAGSATAIAMDAASQPIGSPATVGASQFWFTSSVGDEKIGGLAGGVAQPMEAIPAVAHDLGIETWLASIVERAGASGVDTSRVPSMPVINVRARGGLFDDPRAQEALLWAMDWESAASSAFPNQEGRIIGLIPSAVGDHPHDLAGWGPDFERAQAIFAEFGLPETDSIPVLADDEGAIPEVAKKWSSYLQELKLPVKLVIEKPGVADALYPDFGSGKDPIIWLSSH